MYSYSFKSSAEPSHGSWATAIYYNSLKSDWQVSSPDGRDSTIIDARKFSAQDLKAFDKICSRLASEPYGQGIAKAEGVFKVNDEESYRVGFICNSKLIATYFQEEGNDLTSVIHDNFDAAVNDFLSYLI